MAKVFVLLHQCCQLPMQVVIIVSFHHSTGERTCIQYQSQPHIASNIYKGGVVPANARQDALCSPFAPATPEWPRKLSAWWSIVAFNTICVAACMLSISRRTMFRDDNNFGQIIMASGVNSRERCAAPAE